MQATLDILGRVEISTASNRLTKSLKTQTFVSYSWSGIKSCARLFRRDGHKRIARTEPFSYPFNTSIQLTKIIPEGSKTYFTRILAPV